MLAVIRTRPPLCGLPIYEFLTSKSWCEQQICITGLCLITWISRIRTKQQASKSGLLLGAFCHCLLALEMHLELIGSPEKSYVI